jgi:hypothetical protein
MALTVGNGVAYTTHNYIGYRNWHMHTFRAIDVRNPAHPTLLHESEGSGWPVRLQAEGTLLYVGTPGIPIYDVSNPAAPALVGPVSTWEVTDFAVAGAAAYVLEPGGLTIFDISTPAAPRQRGHYTLLSSVDGVRVVGSTLYAYGPHGVQIIDVADPRQPRILSQYQAGGIRDIQVAGPLVYAAGRDFLIIDASDPLSPTLRGAMRYVSAVDLELAGATAYLGIQHCSPAIWPGSGCQYIFASHSTVDVSDPAAPTLVDSHAYPPSSDYNSYLQDVELADGSLYAALQTGIDAHNLASGESQLYPVGYIRDFELAGQRLYAASTTALQIYDASDPQALPLLGSLDVPDPRDVEISGTLAYVASDSGVQVVSAADPAQPHLLASYATFAAASDVEVVGDLIYVAEGEGGLEILRYIGPSETVMTLTPAGGSLSSPDGRLTLSFPAGAVTEPVRLTLLDYPRPPHALSLREHAVRTFALTATGASGSLAELAQPYALTLRYTPAQLHAQAVPESTLGLAIWAGGAWQDAPCETCVFSPQTDQLSVSSPSLGTFALRGRPFQVLMPVVQR